MQLLKPTQQLATMQSTSSRLSEIAKDPNLFEDDDGAPEDMRKMFQLLLRCHQAHEEEFAQLKRTQESQSMALLDMSRTLKEVCSCRNCIAINLYRDACYVIGSLLLWRRRPG